MKFNTPGWVTVTSLLGVIGVWYVLYWFIRDQPWYVQWSTEHFTSTQTVDAMGFAEKHALYPKRSDLTYKNGKEHEPWQRLDNHIAGYVDAQRVGFLQHDYVRIVEDTSNTPRTNDKTNTNVYVVVTYAGANTDYEDPYQYKTPLLLEHSAMTLTHRTTDSYIAWDNTPNSDGKNRMKGVGYIAQDADSGEYIALYHELLPQTKMIAETPRIDMRPPATVEYLLDCYNNCLIWYRFQWCLSAQGYHPQTPTPTLHRSVQFIPQKRHNSTPDESLPRSEQGGGVWFDGKTSYISMTPELPLRQIRGWMGWINPESRKCDMSVLFCGNGYNRDSVSLSFWKKTGYLVLSYHEQENTVIHEIAYGAHIPVGEWSHIALTFSHSVESMGRWMLYVNGKKVHETNDVQCFHDVVTRNNYLGTSLDTQASHFHGRMKDIRFYRNMLDESFLEDTMEIGKKLLLENKEWNHCAMPYTPQAHNGQAVVIDKPICLSA